MRGESVMIGEICYPAPCHFDELPSFLMLEARSWDYYTKRICPLYASAKIWTDTIMGAAKRRWDLAVFKFFTLKDWWKQSKHLAID